MKLLDFKQDEKMNALRLAIGNDGYGEFELFDPRRHLSWQERKLLIDSWKNVPTSILHAYSDQTLAYKNSHVFAKTDEHFHFSLCDKLKKRISQGRLLEINITLNEGLIKTKSVCEYCLHAVSYQGFDAYRRRHEEYNQRIIKKFNIERYLLEKYPKKSSS